jgi:hypothetical protein
MFVPMGKGEGWRCMNDEACQSREEENYRAEIEAARMKDRQQASA